LTQARSKCHADGFRVMTTVITGTHLISLVNYTRDVPGICNCTTYVIIPNERPADAAAAGIYQRHWTEECVRRPPGHTVATVRPSVRPS